MSSTKYVKGVRTRYRNCLEKEIENCTEIQKHGLEIDNKDDEVLKINKCIKLLKTYIEKVENQCEKYIALLKDEEIEDIETIMDEDYGLCERAMESCLELEELRDKLVSETNINVDQAQASNLQKQMQDFISEHSSKQNEFMENQSYNQQKFMSDQISQQNETIEKLSKPNARVTSVKLPKLELKSFNGDKMRWPEFWDTFECTVHSNKQLSDTEKFSYLQGKLVGEAKTAVSGLALCNENYKIAVAMLRERFGQKQEIIDLHYRAMMSISPAINKTETLRQFLDEMEKHLRSLQVMDENINQNMFVSMLKSKIPKAVLLHMEVQKGTVNEWTVSSLRESLRAYIIARERAEQDSIQDTQRNLDQYHGHHVGQRNENKGDKFSTKKNDRFNISRRQPQISAETLVSGDRKTNGYFDKCRYCANRHWSDECTKFKTIADRKKLLSDSCFKCLKVGHKSNECRQSKICVHCGEKDVHHRSLCPKKFSVKSQRVKTESANVTEEIQNQAITTEEVKEGVFVTSSEIVLMQTAQTEAKINGTKTTKTVRLLLDSGSQRTYVTEHLAEQLGLVRGGVQEIKLVTFGSNKSKVIRTPSTKLDIKLKDGKYLTISANIVPDITGTIERKAVQLAHSNDIQALLKTVDMADTVPTVNEYSTVDMLIGNDFYLDIMLPQRIEIKPGLYLLSSKLGWILTGRTKADENDMNETGMLILTHGTKIVHSNCVTAVDESLPRKPDLEDFWALESIGIKDNPMINDDDKAMLSFRETLKVEDGRYSVTWPWKDNTPDLPINCGLALGRLRTTVKRMIDKPELMNKYDSVIKEQLSNGIIEKVSGDTEAKGGVMHYLPHHAVITPHKTTTKLRLVYDASAKASNNSKSLNECLHRGPVMLHNLCGILMRFRTHNVAVVADIEKAFLQVQLQEDQRNVTRFLWLKNHEKPTTERENIQEYRFCRVPFGIISSPFILGATIECHLESFGSELAEKIKNNIYVDNLITGTPSETEAIELYKTSKHIFEKATMNLREWSTNSDMVNTIIAEEDKATSEIIGVLGHKWNTKEDTLSLNQPTKVNTTGYPTKRTILKVIASVFDPLGLFSPAIVRGKVLLQSLWSKHLDWDDVLEENDALMWNSINEDLVKIPQVTLPRCIALPKNEQTKYGVVCFCDASTDAYAATVYLHQENKEIARSDLIFSKSRLAPIKMLTIPRLELMAVLIGIRCIKFVKDNLSLQIENTHIWSDSQCVLHWIASEKVSSVFVENRLREIKGSGVKEFHYIPSSDNPADLVSRGVSVHQLKENRQWWHGPDWLSQPFSSWKTCDFQTGSSKQDEMSEKVEVQEEKANAFVVKETYTNAPFEIESENYSTASKLLRVTAFALRFIRKLRKQKNEHTHLTKEELDEAENMWILHIQRKHFGNVIHALTKGTSNNLQRQLGIVKDKSDILRCRGRMQNAALCEDSREPILLPKGDRYTDLVIERVHKTLLHSGVSQTLSGVRSRFWIVSGRATVKRVLGKCISCRRHEGGAYQMPPMAPLPKQRVTESAPFLKVGLDYLGPLYVKTADGTSKIWICLFTCLVTRAVHLEMMQNLSAEEFLMGLRRFIACRGKPDEIISDNAQQFKLAGETIGMIWRNIVRCEDVQNAASENGIKWKFIVEYAPWMGGFYERLVGLVKRSLRKTIGRKLLTKVQMQTIIKEAEAIVNTRPLVYVGDDIKSAITLTPAHFLALNPKVGLPETSYDEDDEYTPYESSSKRLIQIWKKGQKLLNQFWKLWKTEYLLSLRERTQSQLKTHRVQSHIVPNVGNVVLIKDDVPRCCWRFGRITTLLKSSDDQIRSAKVKLASGRVIGRPLNLLFPIEVSGTNDQYSSGNKPVALHRQERPKRKAAEIAERNLKQYFSYAAKE